MKKDRTKNAPTPKQNKWKNPFYAYSRIISHGIKHVLKTDYPAIVQDHIEKANK